MTATHEAADVSPLPVPRANPSNQLQARLQALHEAAANKIADAVPLNTRRAYATDRADWQAFCEGLGVEPHPVSEEVLAWYATELLEKGSASVAPDKRRPLKVSTVERRLSAVATETVERGYPAPVQRAARKVIAGHNRSHPPRPRQAAAAGVEDLRALVRAARAQEQADGQPARRRRARDACLILVGWHLMLRRSEGASLMLGDFRWHELGMEVAVRRPKTTEKEVWQAVRYRGDPELCAVRAVRSWVEILAEEGHTAATTPLLCRITRTDALPTQPKALSPHSVNAIVGTMANKAGLTKHEQGPASNGLVQSYTGHSLRRGPITVAARNRASREEISRRSGHVKGSRTLEGYIEQGDQWAGDLFGGIF
ncbi:hypothetical protein [Nocardiopsis synnemataformans]|uniref:hypothetical protein n=1 Tax=Nocardiopsis synnemataformans TaxID=61305 RepID=UPI003EC0A60B